MTADRLEAAERRINRIVELARARYPNVITLESAWDALAADRNETERALAGLSLRMRSRADEVRAWGWYTAADELEKFAAEVAQVAR